MVKEIQNGVNKYHSKSGITGKATSATARAFGKMVTDLEIDIRKLLAKDKLSETDKLRSKK